MRSPTTSKSMAKQICVTTSQELTIQHSQLWHFNSLEMIPRQLSNSRYRTRACSSQVPQTRVVWLWHPPRMDPASLGISTKLTTSSFLIMWISRLAGRRLHVEIICATLRVTRTCRRWEGAVAYVLHTCIMNTTYSVIGIVSLGNQNTQKSLILSMASYRISKAQMFSFLLWPWWW
jgi:hypothetical protein